MPSLGVPELLIFGLVIAGAVFALRRRMAPKKAPPLPQGQAARAARPSVQSSPPSRGSIKVFLSYRRQDSADVTGRIYDRLVQRLGSTSVFKDVDSVPLGVDYRQHVGRVIATCEVVVAIIGDQWIAAADSQGSRRLDDPGDLVRIELESALVRGIPVIPVLVKGAAMPRESELPSSLKDLVYRNGLAVRADPDFNTDMDRLLAGVSTTVS